MIGPLDRRWLYWVEHRCSRHSFFAGRGTDNVDEQMMRECSCRNVAGSSRSSLVIPGRGVGGDETPPEYCVGVMTGRQVSEGGPADDVAIPSWSTEPRADSRMVVRV